MTCDACTRAMENPTTARMLDGCDGCRARALAVTRVDLLGRKQALEAIAKVFGAQAQRGEQLVREWLQRIKQAEAGQKARAKTG